MQDVKTTVQCQAIEEQLDNYRVPFGKHLHNRLWCGLLIGLSLLSNAYAKDIIVGGRYVGVAPDQVGYPDTEFTGNQKERDEKCANFIKAFKNPGAGAKYGCTAEGKHIPPTRDAFIIVGMH